MRLIKMLGLAAITALAAMAFIGASSASADKNTCITETDTVLLEDCPNPPLFLHFYDPAATLLTSTPKLTIKCEALLFGEGLKLGKAPSPLEIHVKIDGLKYSNCNNGCEATNTKEGLILVLKTAVELGVVTAHGFLVHLVCGEAIDCEYNAQGLEGHALGGLLALPLNNPHVNLANEEERAHVTFADATVNTPGGGFCPATAKLTALFLSLVKLYLRG